MLNPSDQDILIRFDTWAINANGQKSPPILQLPSPSKPRPAESDITVLVTEDIASNDATEPVIGTPHPSEEDHAHEDSPIVSLLIIAMMAGCTQDPMPVGLKKLSLSKFQVMNSWQMDEFIIVRQS